MRFGLGVASALVVMMSVAAKADTMDGSVTGSGGGVSGKGVLYTTSNGNGSYTITSMTGSGVGTLIDPTGFYGNDNLLFPDADTLLSDRGFSFTDRQGNTSFEVNIHADGVDSYSAHIVDIDNVIENVPVTFSLDDTGGSTALLQAAAMSDAGATRTFNFSFAPAESVAVAPEPASFALLGTGLLGLAGLVRRRTRS